MITPEFIKEKMTRFNAKKPKERRIYQKQLAVRAGASVEYISMLFNGKIGRPSAYMLDSLDRALSEMIRERRSGNKKASSVVGQTTNEQ